MNLEKKITKEMTVQADVSNKDINSDYKIVNEYVSPHKVKVIGGEHQWIILRI